MKLLKKKPRVRRKGGEDTQHTLHTDVYIGVGRCPPVFYILSLISIPPFFLFRRYAEKKRKNKKAQGSFAEYNAYQLYVPHFFHVQHRPV